MIESRLPGVGAVAALAAEGKSCFHMIDGSCIAKILDVTEGAIGVEPTKKPDGCAFMAALASCQSVRPNEREAVRMFIYALRNLAPSMNRVALFAISP